MRGTKSILEDGEAPEVQLVALLLGQYPQRRIASARQQGGWHMAQLHRRVAPEPSVGGGGGRGLIPYQNN